MKRSLILALALVLLAGGGLISTHAGLQRSGRQVVLTEEETYGDPEAAEGLTLSIYNDVADRLHWRTDLTFGEKGTEYSTEHRFTRDRENVPSDPRYTVEFWPRLNFGVSSSGELELEGDPLLWSVSRLLPELVERTPAGGTYTETFRYGDYYDCLPMGVDIDLPGRHWSWDELQFLADDRAPSGEAAERYQIMLDLSDAFQFPVPEDMTVTLSLSKDENGAPYMLDCDGDNFTGPEVFTAGNPWYFYFILEAREGDKLADYSHTPGGYGIYRLPTVKEDEPLRFRDLEMVGALPEEWHIRSLDADYDGNRLLMVTQERGYDTLRVLDMDLLHEVQTIPLGKSPEHAGAFYVAEDFIVRQTDGDYGVYTRSPEGMLHFEFSTPREREGEESLAPMTWRSREFAFDGRRLAAVVNDNRTRDERTDVGCGVVVEIYDKTGPLYGVHYGSSLTRNHKDNQGRDCTPRYNDALIPGWS